MTRQSFTVTINDGYDGETESRYRVFAYDADGAGLTAAGVYKATFSADPPPIRKMLIESTVFAVPVRADAAD